MSGQPIHDELMDAALLAADGSVPSTFSLLMLNCTGWRALGAVSGGVMGLGIPASQSRSGAIWGNELIELGKK